MYISATSKRAVRSLLALFCLVIVGIQAFSNDLYAQVMLSCRPLKKIKITSPFGQRIHPVTRTMSFHNGIDLAASADTVYSMIGGTVRDIGCHRHLGRFISLGNGSIEIIYGHLSRVLVHPGQQLPAGTSIGITGRTGRVTGEHLHLSVRFEGQYLDPLKFISALVQEFEY